MGEFANYQGEQIKIGTCDGSTTDIDDAVRLAELVLGLNEWLERGGFPPANWHHPATASA